MIAVLGDTHVPGRARQIPESFIRELKKAGPEKILFTGDAVSESVIRKLEEISPVIRVKGNMDHPGPAIKQEIDWQVKILLHHGSGIHPRGDHEQLQALARENNCQIIITGHTHENEVWQGDHAIIINPGSATGVWGGNTKGGKPSLMFLETNNKLLRVTTLTLEQGELRKQSRNLNLRRIY